jgi:hypothetical protein
MLRLLKEELPRLMRESSDARSMPAVPLGRSRKLPGQAAGERRGEGEPELERRSAPSHPL